MATNPGFKNLRPNFTQDVTDKVISLMEGEHLKPWEVSWDRGLTKAFNPYSRTESSNGSHSVKGRPYRGGNALNLLMGQLARDSADPRWLTFKQANEAGLRVRKGARAEVVMYWKFPDAKDQVSPWKSPQDKPSQNGVYKLKSGQYAAHTDQGWMKEADTIQEARAMRIHGSRVRGDAHQWAGSRALQEADEKNSPKAFFVMVFNGADIVGMPPMKERRVFDGNERAERLIQATGAVINHRELSTINSNATGASSLVVNRAFYDPALDEITVPPRGHFKTSGDYYRTLIHEIAHWTGHETRLNRGLTQFKSGTPEYAWEELRAEMASAMICEALGVAGGLGDHAAYLEEYVKLLKEDRSAIFKAARDAEKIYSAVLEFDPELRAELEGHLADNSFSVVSTDDCKENSKEFVHETTVSDSTAETESEAPSHGLVEHIPPPHEQSFDQFKALATVVELQNHPRKWDVHYPSNFSSFSDEETADGALKDVHRAAVSNAIYLNTIGKESGISSSFPPPEVLAEYTDLLDKFNRQAEAEKTPTEAKPEENLASDLEIDFSDLSWDSESQTKVTLTQVAEAVPLSADNALADEIGIDDFTPEFENEGMFSSIEIEDINP